MWRTDDTLACQALSFTLLEKRSHIVCHSEFQASWSPRFRGSPAFASHLTVRTLGFQTHTNTRIFTWVDVF